MFCVHRENIFIIREIYKTYIIKDSKVINVESNVKEPDKIENTS